MQDMNTLVVPFARRKSANSQYHLRYVDCMRSQRQQALDACTVSDLLRPESVILSAQLQQPLALLEQVRVRIAHRLHCAQS